MGLFDDLDKAMKKVEAEINKAELDKQVKDLEQGMNKAGHELSAEIKNAQDSPSQKATAPVSTGSAGARSPHPGYAKITAWVKRTWGSRISSISDPDKKKTELEQMAAESCSGLSEKTRKGFLAYLKSQNYEQLLK
jgi:hypothetical protein